MTLFLSVSGVVDSAVCGSSASLMITVSPGSNLESSQGYTEAESGFTIPSTINCDDGELVWSVFIPSLSCTLSLVL